MSFIPRKLLLCAEIGAAEGDYQLAKELVISAVESGADLIKAQIYRAKELAHPILLEKQFERFLQLELEEEVWKELSDLSKSKGVPFFASVFGPYGIKLAKKLNFPWVKIASGDLNFYHFINQVSLLKKPMLISTGMSNVSEIREALRSIDSNLWQDKIALLHCISIYPTPMDHIRLEYIGFLRDTFGVPVGHSDHSDSIEVCQEAVLRGAEIIEKHFTITPEREKGDHCHSLTPEEFRDFRHWLDKEFKQEDIVYDEGFNVNLRDRPDKKNIKIMRRGLYASKNLPQDTQLTSDHILTLRPCEGKTLSVCLYKELLGKKIRKKVEMYEPFVEDHFR